MAGREISSTLRNLKFMQRAAQKEEKKKEEEEEVVSNGGFGSLPAVSKKCVVIMEGDPHPEAVKGRMSFQNFNPSVDKLAEDLENRSKDPGTTAPSSQNGASRNGDGGTNEDSEMSDSKKDHKRKQTVTESEETQFPSKSPKNDHNNQQARASSNKKKSSKKKHQKNNWSVLRPPKSEGRRN